MSISYDLLLKSFLISTSSQIQTPFLDDFEDVEDGGEIQDHVATDNEEELGNTCSRTKSAKSSRQSESEYDKIHSEIQELTMKLSSGLNIADILRGAEKQGEEEQQKPETESQKLRPESILTRIRTDNIGAMNFAVMGASPVLTPRLPATSKEMVEGDQVDRLTSEVRVHVLYYAITIRFD